MTNVIGLIGIFLRSLKNDASHLEIRSPIRFKNNAPVIKSQFFQGEDLRKKNREFTYIKVAQLLSLLYIHNYISLKSTVLDVRRKIKLSLY